MTAKEIVAHSLLDAQTRLNTFVANPANLDTIDDMAGWMKTVFEHDGRIFICGNGGSLCDAMHFAEECTGKFRDPRHPLPVMALADPAHLTCVANDFGFDEVFVRPIKAFGQPGDLLIAISTSGNSANVIRAAQVAQGGGMGVFGLLGRDGGKLKPHCDLYLIAPGETSDRIQEIHMMVLHILVESVEYLMEKGRD